MHPGLVCVAAASALAALVWILSLLTHEYSWTDRIWSLAPIGYAWVFAGAAHLGDARLDVVAVLITLWGARLTFNFARKGGYAAGGQDYRWGVLRARMKPWQFAIFNLAFIAIYQNVIIAAITAPMWAMYDHRGRFGRWEVTLSVLTLLAIAGEAVADEQQWRFQQQKKAVLATGGQPETGFLRTGMFGYCRHPNFFCELSIWWLVFLFAVCAAPAAALPTIAGSILLTLLFVGSVRLTEAISVSRYPAYARYQQERSAVVPWLPKTGRG